MTNPKTTFHHRQAEADAAVPYLLREGGYNLGAWTLIRTRDGELHAFRFTPAPQRDAREAGNA